MILMNKKIIGLALSVGLLAMAGFACLPIGTVLAQGVTIPNPLSAGNFGDLLTQIVTAVGALIATLGTIMLIWAGILYLTSGGSPERTGNAKKALIYAIVGIIVGLAATTIVTIIKGIIGA